jgi:8-oxo-dGTP pyrophosphatase MutT (NUDIX family)
MSEQKPENFRAYGILIREGRVLISAEYIGEIFCWKFPGGRVEDGESAEDALIREFQEEATLDIIVEQLLHAPGTLLSPWTGANYTPIYFQVSGSGEVKVPAHEPLELTFKDPGDVLGSELMARPEKLALNHLLEEHV